MDPTADARQGSKGKAAHGDQLAGATRCKLEQYTKATWQDPPKFESLWTRNEVSRPMEGKEKGKEKKVVRARWGKEEEEAHRVVDANGHHCRWRKRVQGKSSEWRLAIGRRQL